MNQDVARCNHCGANLSLDDMRGQNCPYCQTVLPHHARAAEQAALVNQMLQQRGLAPQVPYQFGAAPPGIYHVSGPQVIIGAPAGGPPNPAFPATPVDELQRIAAAAQQRQAEFAAKAQVFANSAADDNVAVALGTHYGSPGLRLVVVLMCLALLAAAVGAVLSLMGAVNATLVAPIAGACGVGAFVLLFVRLFVTPRASRSRRAAEEAWLRGLPFALTGYFEALGMEPRITRQVQVHIDWASPRMPHPQELLGLIQRRDPGARGAPGDPSGWVSGEISGSATGIARGNHRVVRYVHDVVRDVLFPMHHQYPLARVTLRRDW